MFIINAHRTRLQASNNRITDTDKDALHPVTDRPLTTE